MNKKLLFLSFSLLMSVAAMAQNIVSCDTIAFFTQDGGVVLDYYSNYYLRDLIVLEVQEEDSVTPGHTNYTPLDLRIPMDYISEFNYTITGNPYVLTGFSNYNLTIGNNYRVAYRLPENFRYKSLSNNPYNSFSIGIYGEGPNGLTTYQELATININNTLYLGQYWLCSGQDDISGAINYSDWTEFSFPFMNYLSGTHFYIGVQFY